MKSASKRTGTFGKEWKGQNESKDFSLKRPVLQKVISLVLKTEEKKVKVMGTSLPQVPTQSRALFQEHVKSFST